MNERINWNKISTKRIKRMSDRNKRNKFHLNCLQLSSATFSFSAKRKKKKRKNEKKSRNCTSQKAEISSRPRKSIIHRYSVHTSPKKKSHVNTGRGRQHSEVNSLSRGSWGKIVARRTAPCDPGEPSIERKADD